MIRPILIFIIAIAASASATFAQSPLRFEATTHDFGTLAEDGGSRTHTFRYTNTAKNPIVVLRTGTSCGCTTTQFSRKPIGQNQSGEIEVTFDPMNQPGRFSRKIIVYTSQGNSELTITGVVTPRKKSDDEIYCVALCEGVAIDANSHAFGYIEHGGSSRSAFEIINRSTHDATIRLTPTDASGMLDIDYPKLLKAGERGAINFGYELPEGCNTYGTISDVVAVEINSVQARLPLVFHAIAIDKREKIAESEGAKIQLSENFIKFGTIKRDSTPTPRQITIENIGLKSLGIRRIECDNDVFEAKIAGPTTVESDETTTLSVAIRPSKAAIGIAVGRIRIISNDPHSPMRSIKVTAIIEN